MTAYRQQALAVAKALAGAQCRPRDLRVLAPDAAKILQGNVYGWFERIERGPYGLTPSGRVAPSHGPTMSFEAGAVFGGAPTPQRTSWIGDRPPHERSLWLTARSALPPSPKHTRPQPRALELARSAYDRFLALLTRPKRPNLSAR